MQRVLTACLAVMGVVGGSAAAWAHPGHVEELTGHTHWVGIAALAGAALIAVGILVARRHGSWNGKQDTGHRDTLDAAEKSVR